MPVHNPVWQHPYVNIFKLCGVDAWRDAKRQGDVSAALDRTIGKPVVRINGSISAANFLRLPRSRDQSLGLIGRFLYLQVKIDPLQTFVIHAETQTQDQGLHRVSVSNLYKPCPRKHRQGAGVQLPLIDATSKWTVIAVDMKTALEGYTSSPFQCLRSLQLCSVMTVRNIYTSDLKFTLKSLPRDMALSHAVDPHNFELRWLPAEPLDAVAHTPSSLSPEQVREVRQAYSGRSLSSAPSCVSLPGKATKQCLAQEPDTAPAACAEGLQCADEDPIDSTDNSGSDRIPAVRPTSGVVGVRPTSGVAAQYGAAGRKLPQQVVDMEASKDQAVAAAAGDVLEPDPLLRLERMQGYTGEFLRSLLWPPQSEEVVFASADTVIAMKADGSGQRFFPGHTSYVTAIAFDGSGCMMATAQDGKHALIRVWDFVTGRCLAILQGHASSIMTVDVSSDGKALLGVGLDVHGKQLIILWDLVGVQSGSKPQVVARQVSEHSIKCAKFSAFEADRFLSCGQDSIRTWRLKGNKLHSMSVRLAAPGKPVHARAGGLLAPTVFTDIAYEAGLGSMQMETKCAYVSTASGAVFVINCIRHTVECIYQLHVSAINALVVHEGFCLTASDDHFLRVWPLDFCDHLLEAEHEGPVTSVGVSHEGLRICSGTENGTLGVLDIGTHQYTTLLRSHTARVLAVAADPNRQEYCTVSEDGSIRIWDLGTYHQLYEFDAPAEVPRCVAYHPVHHELACGFASGTARLFDVQSTSLIQEHRQHKAAVEQVLYTADGERLLTAGADGSICVYDVSQVYLPIRMLSTNGGPGKVCMAVSGLEGLLATVSYDAVGASLLLFHTSTLEPFVRIETDTSAFKRLQFSPDARELWALTSDSELHRFELCEGVLLQRIVNLHPPEALAMHANLCRGSYVATGGCDSLLRIWGVTERESLRGNPIPPHQSFAGHPGTILDIAHLGQHVITVGEGDCISIWRLLTPTPAPDPIPYHPSAACHSVPTTLRSWAEAPTSSPTTHPAAATSSTSPLPASPNTLPLPACHPSPTTYHPSPKLPCTCLVGYTADQAANMLWRHHSALFAYTVQNVLVLEGLQSRRQQFAIHHSNPISCLALSPDGTTIAAGASAPDPASGGADICLWDTGTLQRTGVLHYHQCAVQAMEFSPDGRFLASIGRDPECSVVLWRRASCELVAAGRSRAPLLALSWLPQREVPELLTVGASGPLLWSVQSTCLEQRRLAGVLSSAPLEDSGGGLGGDEREECCTAVRCEEDGVALVADEHGRVWELLIGPTEQATTTSAAIKRAHLPGQRITAICSSASRVTVATASGLVTAYMRGVHTPDGTATPTTLPSGPWAVEGEQHLDGEVVALQLDPSACEGLASTRGATVWYLDAPAGTRVPLICGHTDDITSLCSGPHPNPCLMASTAGDGILRIWTAAQRAAEPLVEFQVHGTCTAAELLPSGTHCAAGYRDGLVRLFNVPRAVMLWACPAHPSPVLKILSHPNQPIIMSASSDGTLAATQLASGKLLCASTALSNRASPLHDLALSHRNGTMCGAAFADHLEVFTAPWTDPTFHLAAKYNCPQVPSVLPAGITAAVSFAPATPHALLYTSPCLVGRCILFDYRRASVLRSYTVNQHICSMAATPDGSVLAFGGVSGSAFLADYKSRKIVELPGHGCKVAAVQFTADGRLLYSAAGCTMYAWGTGAVA